MHPRSLLVILLVLPSVSSTFPCSQYGSDLYGEINCLRRLLSQCTTDKMNRETRTVSPTPPSTPESATQQPTTTSATTTTTTSTSTTTPVPTTQWTEQVTEFSEEWPTPNSALIIDALKYELSREIEEKIREANKKFDEKMSAYQVQMEMEMKKINARCGYLSTCSRTAPNSIIIDDRYFTSGKLRNPSEPKPGTNCFLPLHKDETCDQSKKDVRMMKLKVHRRANYEYLLSDERESWYTASEICIEWGGHLVSIKDYRENSFIAAFVPSGESAWIGLNDIQREDQFVNANGDKTTYRKWEDGQPDNMYHNENCVEMMGGEGRWRDSLCLLTKRFICRRS